MPLLMILRHAKSAWPDVPDRERPLSDRGRRHAPRAGRWLRDTGIIPDHVTCSTACRAYQTWQLVEGALRTSPPVTYDDRLYAADREDVLAVIRETADWVTRLLIIGHEPSMRDVTLHLAGNSGGELLEQVRTKFPTGALATLRIPSGWADLDEGCGTLVGFFTPRQGGVHP
ncbi:SixA phosphatase family protein [Amycolatopsis taiwanensis]|uniref:SixA phosphatase family protein n=1 Tax=Amycolatopsis taiwanensis TaxID=342230 RepID=UPI000486D28C|nr:histidine phosphatase family protein [Amycolatopsis taiwanensis]